jgi:predicted ATP-dependent endonuclease of OLD family
MFIKNIKLKNFKCFSDLDIDFSIPNWEDWSWLNILVWENNSWKSSLIEAIHFLRNKSTKNIKKIWINDDWNDFFVEQTFVWNIDNVIDNFIQENKKESFRNCLYEEDWNKYFKVKREFKNDSDIKKILFFNNWDYSNVSWIDWVFQKFFQISNIWADTSPENESKFWSSTICWNLLSEISDKFKTDNSEFDDFLVEFNKMFNDDDSWLQLDLNNVANETQQILNEQFWNASLKFKFNNPEPNILFKNIKILVNDWEETDISEKWHWLQRAIILSLLQVYAKRITQIDDGDWNINLKPHFLFIDEPEMWLHPQAQKKLFDALKILSKNHQIFISSHSENFISLDTIENIYKFQKEWDSTIIKSIRNFDININENRNFFFHHHKLFFTKKAIFFRMSRWYG